MFSFDPSADYSVPLFCKHALNAHIGADRNSKLVANLSKAAQLLRGDETQVPGYTGVEKRPEIVAPSRQFDRQVARKRGLVKALAQGAQNGAIKAGEHANASVRVFVEHLFHIVKNPFRSCKTRYRGLAKNGHQLHALFGLADVIIAARRVLA